MGIELWAIPTENQGVNNHRTSNYKAKKIYNHIMRDATADNTSTSSSMSLWSYNGSDDDGGAQRHDPSMIETFTTAVANFVEDEVDMLNQDVTERDPRKGGGVVAGGSNCGGGGGILLPNEILACGGCATAGESSRNDTSFYGGDDRRDDDERSDFLIMKYNNMQRPTGDIPSLVSIAGEGDENNDDDLDEPVMAASTPTKKKKRGFFLFRKRKSDNTIVSNECYEC